MAGNSDEGGNSLGDLARSLLNSFEAILVCQEPHLLPLVILLCLTKKLAKNASNLAILASPYPSSKSLRIVLQTVKI